jgi:hypothetical protein
MSPLPFPVLLIAHNTIHFLPDHFGRCLTGVELEEAKDGHNQWNLSPHHIPPPLHYLSFILPRSFHLPTPFIGFSGHSKSVLNGVVVAKTQGGKESPEPPPLLATTIATITTIMWPFPMMPCTRLPFPMLF